VVDGLQSWLREDRSDTLAWLARFKVDLKPFKSPHPMSASMKQAREEAQAAIQVAAGARYAPLAGLVRGILAGFEERYLARKRARAVVDFSDLEELALQLLRQRPDVRALTQQRFEAVLMDEVQDTNPIQWRIIDEIRRPGRFFGVGDANQSIYGFRHADPELFAGFERDVAAGGGVIDRLEENYRSRRPILDTVVRIAGDGRLRGVRPHELRAGREYPPAAGPAVEITRVAGENSEAEWLARRLAELHGRLMVGDPPKPADWGDMAVLARTTSMFGEIEQALGRQNIPCVMRRGKNFYAEPEVVDLTNWLRVLENPGDEVALFGLLRSPLHGVSDEEMLGLRIAGQRLAPDGSWARIEQARALRAETPISVLLGRELDETGYLERLDPRARANVEKFHRLLRSFEARAPGDLSAWLEEIDGLRKAGQEPNAAVAEESDAVQVMTVHTAKGLEFPVVALAAMRKGSGGRQPSIAWSEAGGLGMKWRLEGVPAPVQDSSYALAMGEQARREALEENRLLYVALTRAEERLLLFWGDRGEGVWAGVVERALEVAWPEEPNAPVETGDLRITLAEGTPEVLDLITGAETKAPPVTLMPRPAELEPVPKLSVTALSRFDACPRRYLLAHILGWPLPEDGEAEGEGEAARFGTEVHEALAGNPTDVPEVAELVDRFRASSLGRRLETASRVEREFDFLVEIDGTLLEGKIDLWFEEPGRRVIVDYKTNRRLLPGQLAEYELGLYSLALEKLGERRPAEAWLYMARSGEALQVHLDEELFKRVRIALERQRGAESRGEYEMTEGPGCAYCTFLSRACSSTWRESAE
jgi:ATP-dependent exoDNAse (exonuclease V) beta subunit